GTPHPARPGFHARVGGSPPTAAGALDACRRLSAALDTAARLEFKRRPDHDDSIHVPLVKFVESQVRMRLMPALSADWPARDPVHVVLFGGTNSGKSTVLNLLLGRPVAGMNALPRFSQHPVGFSPTLGVDWLDRFPSRFGGYARHVNQHPPRQSDAELRKGYKPAVALVRPDSVQPGKIVESAQGDAVLWDVPDFSTVQARAYMSAVIDAAAMADVIVVTVTTESYLDDRGGALLHLLVDSGAAVHVVANKVTGDPQLMDDIRATVGTDSRGRKANPAAVHQLPMIDGADPQRRLEALLNTRNGTDLRNAVAAEAARGDEVKRASLRGAVEFVDRRLAEALAPLDREAAVDRSWNSAVDKLTQLAVVDRYASQYIQSGRYSEFNRTLARLMELIEIPIISDILQGAATVLRWPFSWVKRRILGANKPPTPPEEEVLTELIDAWILGLRSEAQQRQEAAPHPAWAHIVRQLESQDFRDRIFAGGFASGYKNYREKLEQEERERANALYQKLRESPVLLNSLRALMTGADATALFFTIKTMGGLDWSDLVVGPLMLKVRRWFTEKGLGAYLETQKEGLMRWQQAAMTTLVFDTLATPAWMLFKSEVQPEAAEKARKAWAEVKAALRAKM
ncbi:MAG TPA: hypothetical protein VF796_28100, partial [Humisphaera sp.]